MRERKYINIKKCLNVKNVDIWTIKSVNESITNIVNGIKNITYNDETLYYSINDIMDIGSVEKWIYIYEY